MTYCKPAALGDSPMSHTLIILSALCFTMALSGGSGMVGGWQPMAANDESVQTNSRFAAQKINQQANSLQHKKFIDVHAAEVQVVAGIKYKLVFYIGTTTLRRGDNSEEEVANAALNKDMVCLIVFHISMMTLLIYLSFPFKPCSRSKSVQPSSGKDPGWMSASCWNSNANVTCLMTNFSVPRIRPEKKRPKKLLRLIGYESWYQYTGSCHIELRLWWALFPFLLYPVIPTLSTSWDSKILLQNWSNKLKAVAWDIPDLIIASNHHLSFQFKLASVVFQLFLSDSSNQVNVSLWEFRIVCWVVWYDNRWSCLIWEQTDQLLSCSFRWYQSYQLKAVLSEWDGKWFVWVQVSTGCGFCSKSLLQNYTFDTIHRCFWFRCCVVKCCSDRMCR